MSKFKDVFEANPKANELFVVDGVPFLKRTTALNYAGGDEAKVEVVKKSVKKELTEEEKQAKKDAAAKAKADKAAKAKAKKEAAAKAKADKEAKAE